MVARILITLGIGMGLFLWTMMSLFVCTRPSLDIVERWEQDPAVSYDGAQYMLAVYEDGLDWRGFPFDLRTTHAVYVGRQTQRLEYGHSVRFSFEHSLDLVEDQIRRSQVDWQRDGVWLRTPSGHRLFVPAEMFTGGR